MEIMRMIQNLGFNPKHTKWLIPLLLVADAILTLLIIQKIPYTEIDWTTYMHQTSLYLAGERDYLKITGPTGPLVYPALHLYIHRLLHYLTASGAAIQTAQYLFALLYLLTQTLALSCYRKCGSPPWLLVLLVLSKRLHSVFVLRLFNDCFAAFFLWAAVWCWQRRAWTLGCVVFSAGVGVKMTVVLAAPGVGVVLWLAVGRARTLRLVGVMGQLQILLAFPFLAVAPLSYLSKAFELSRVFLFKWTVNWRFLGEEVFLSQPFSQALLVAHASLLALFTATRWLGPSDYTLLEAVKALVSLDESPNPATTATSPAEPGPSAKPEPQPSMRSQHQAETSRRVTPTFIMTVVLQSMLIGCLCARSLHYQFYAYIAWSTPFLMWRSGLGPIPTALVWAAQEWAWNVYPSTTASSITVVACLATALAASWYGTRETSENLGIEKDTRSKKTA